MAVKTKELREGLKAPSFCLKDATERKVCLKDFSGKWVVLYFYPKDNTPGCTTEAITFSQMLEEFNKRGGIIMGVSPDSCASHRNFMEKHGLKVILLSDPEKEVIKKYGAWGKKVMYGKEREGVIRSTFIISPDGKIMKIWRNVKVNGHAEEVLKALDELRKS